MTRAMLVGGGAVAALLGLAALALSIVFASTATPAAHVQRYLDALARDDRATAARLAGLQPPTAIPVGDEGEPSIRRIIASEPTADGAVEVTAEYGDATDAVRVTFLLEPAPPTLGVIPAWAFAQPPVTALEVAADGHDVVAVNDELVEADAVGRPVTVSVFVPARVTVRLAEPLLRADPVTLRVTGELAQAPVVLAVEPSDRLVRTSQREVERLLAACTEQAVLKPTGCPFGIDIDDRVTEPPAWTLDSVPDVVLDASDRPGVWLLRGEGSVRIVVPVQQLFDGSVSTRDELIGFIVRGEVALEEGAAVLTLYTPED